MISVNKTLLGLILFFYVCFFNSVVLKSFFLPAALFCYRQLLTHSLTHSPTYFRIHFLPHINFYSLILTSFVFRLSSLSTGYGDSD